MLYCSIKFKIYWTNEFRLLLPIMFWLGSCDLLFPLWVMSKIIRDHGEWINFRTKIQVVYFSKSKLIEAYAVLWECLNRTCHAYFSWFVAKNAHIEGKNKEFAYPDYQDCVCFLKKKGGGEQEPKPTFPLPPSYFLSLLNCGISWACWALLCILFMLSLCLGLH